MSSIVNTTPTTIIYTLSLHDALPISLEDRRHRRRDEDAQPDQRGARRDRSELHAAPADRRRRGDRKSTRLNSSHVEISYAVFCLKKKITSRGCLAQIVPARVSTLVSV